MVYQSKYYLLMILPQQLLAIKEHNPLPHLLLLLQYQMIRYLFVPVFPNRICMNKNPWFDPNNGPAKQLVSGNPVLEKAMTFSGPPPVYTPSFHTYVIRSWDGERYYKLQIISWYDANVQIGDEGGRISYYLDELK